MERFHTVSGAEDTEFFPETSTEVPGAEHAVLPPTMEEPPPRQPQSRPPAIFGDRGQPKVTFTPIRLRSTKQQPPAENLEKAQQGEILGNLRALATHCLQQHLLASRHHTSQHYRTWRQPSGPLRGRSCTLACIAKISLDRSASDPLRRLRTGDPRELPATPVVEGEDFSDYERLRDHMLHTRGLQYHPHAYLEKLNTLRQGQYSASDLGVSVQELKKHYERAKIR
ncbi:hypothetical protein Efla_007727 [Eimeria flavescens]